ncbi:MAG: sugar ABC transporter ATP-binding protein [Spirochaetaceae bacterium]|nr:sugar ABC transporter ATP-binding protein [Spirochaetaceae bacterium]
MKNIVLQTHAISKHFESTRALVEVSIELYKGEVLGLIGENGSGKSTLSSIIAGVQKADSGGMFLHGKPYSPASITDAGKKGISMIVQEQGTLNGISVAANIFAGKEGLFSRLGILDIKKMNREAKKLLASIGVASIEPSLPVDKLSFEERKLLEVARSEFNKPEILIVDETTTALGKEGRGVMYQMIKRMRDEGKSVIFISHDIQELLDICSRVTVLRDGRVIGSLSGNEMQAPAMKKMMVGRDIAENMFRNDYIDVIDNNDDISKETLLSAEHITNALLDAISLQVKRGEILGIGGLTDCGMHELGKVLFGLSIPDIGTVWVNNKSGKIVSAQMAIKNRMAYVSKNRDTEALMAACSIKDNMCLPLWPRLKHFGLVPPKKEMNIVKKWGEKLSIKMQNPKQYVMQLSGGNKQKVSIAKWLASEADIFIFDCPTRGIDIGVKNDIYHLLDNLRKEGKAILMISEELPELIGMSDRILILKNGKINGEFQRKRSLSEADLINYMI